MLKKLGALLLAATMAVASLPMTMAVAEEAAWFDLEAEAGTLKKADGTVTISPIIKNDAASAGRYFVANDSFHGASSTMTFSRETEGTYDIWAILGVDDSAYIGSYNFTLDAEEAPFYHKDVAAANLDAVGDALYTSANIAGGAHAKPMKWVKIASKKVIGVGDHTLVASLTKASGTDNKMGVIDVVRFVPSSWNWTPASNLDAPTYVEWQDIEVEAGNCEKNGVANYPVIDDAAASAGKYLIVNDAHVGTTSTMTFESPATRNYDIWAILGVDSSNYIGSYNFTLDGVDKFYDKCISAANGDAVADALYTSSQLTGGSHHKPMRWVRIAASKELTAGEHTLLAAVGPGSGVPNQFGVMDVVRIVPAEWNWVPSANLNAPYDMRPAPDANGILHLEAENGLVQNYNTYENAKASGGKYLGRLRVDGAGSGGSTTLGFKLEEAGMYDIYAALATGSQNYLGGHKFTLDNEVIFEKGMDAIDRSNPDLYGEQINLHSATAHLTTVRWVKIATKELAAGGHTLVNELIQQGNRNGVIDCVRLIPAGMTWNAADFTTMPTAPDYWDLEVENGEVKRPNDPFCGSSDAGDKYIFMNQGNQSNGMNGSTMAFYANEGEYDIWALVGIDDYENGDARLCAYKFYWGSEEAPFAQIENVKGAVSEWNPLYTTGMMAGTIPTYMHWVKIASGIELSGSKILTADIAPCDANGNMCGAIDKVRVVPTAWNHVPTTTTAQPVKPEIIMDGFTMTDKVAGQAITATVTGMKKTVDAEKTAVVIVAAYKDDVLVDIGYSNIATLTGEAQDISAFVTLPADIAGYTVKAFLWNGLETGMPYVTPISK